MPQVKKQVLDELVTQLQMKIVEVENAIQRNKYDLKNISQAQKELKRRRRTLYETRNQLYQEGLLCAQKKNP